MAEFDEYIGVIARTHGMNGTVLLVDTPGTRVNLAPGSSVGVGFSREFAKRMTVTLYEASAKSIRIGFAEAPSAESASPLIDQAVFVRSSDVVASDERYSVGDIEGCEVFNEAGLRLGVISEVWLLPANDVWIVGCEDGSTIPIPVIESVVKQVDVSANTIIVSLLDGLESLNKAQTDDPDDGDEEELTTDDNI